MPHITTYHTSLKCLPTEIFHGRTPHIALDLKFANPIRATSQPKDISKMLSDLNEIHKENMDNIVAAYHKYKPYYDKKASAPPLKVNDFVILLNPKYDDQISKQQFTSFHWQGTYEVTKVLSNSTYSIRRIGTHKTQCVHRKTLWPFVPHNEIDDIHLNQKDLYPDADVIEDTNNFDENLPPLSDNERDNQFDEPTEEINPGNTTPTICDVYVPEVVARRAPIKRQTLARSRHPPMESDEPTDERVSYTPVPPKHVTNSGDSSADSHVNNTCNEPARLANRREPSPQTETERSTRTTASHYNLRANIAPTRYSDHLVHELAMQKQS